MSEDRQTSLHHLFRPADPGTSREAAASIWDSLRPLQQQVLRALGDLGEASDEDLCRALPDLRDSTVRTRRKELVVAGMVADTGRRGRTSTGRRTIIWRLTRGGADAAGR